MPAATPDRALFDLRSFARRGPLQRHHVVNSHVDQIARTAHRTPEVMIKVLAKGAAQVSAAKSHIQYIGRRGDIEINTDDGRKVSSLEFVEELSTDWNLDLDEQRPSSELKSADRRSPPRIIHKVIFRCRLARNRNSS